MGLNTTVVILNDYLHDIENDPEFGKKLSRAIKNSGFNDSTRGFQVVTCHHNSATSVIAVNGNRGRVIGWSMDRATDEELVKELVRRQKRKAKEDGDAH